MAQLCDADWPGRRELYDACLFPLDHIKTHPLEDYQFEPIPNKPDHFILYVEFPEPLTLEYNRNPHTLEYTDNIVVTDSAPALFDIYGYIAVQDCFMSVGADHGIRGVQGTNAPATVSCWFEIGTHLTINNQIQWDRYRAGMKQLVEISGFSYDEASLSKLISEDSKGNMRIRVCKEVTPGHENREVIFADHSGALSLPTTALDVPYGQPYCCTFYLKYHLKPNGIPEFYAEILGITPL